MEDATGSIPSVSGKVRHIRIAHIMTATAQGDRQEPHQLPARQAARTEALRESHEILDAECLLQFGESTERQTKGVAFVAQLQGDLTAPFVRHDDNPHRATKVRAPADSKAISKVTSPA